MQNPCYPASIYTRSKCISPHRGETYIVGICGVLLDWHIVTPGASTVVMFKCSTCVLEISHVSECTLNLTYVNAFLICPGLRPTHSPPCIVKSVLEALLHSARRGLPKWIYRRRYLPASSIFSTCNPWAKISININAASIFSVNFMTKFV